MQGMFQFPLSEGKLSEARAAILFFGFLCHLVEQSRLAESSIHGYSNRHLEFSAAVRLQKQQASVRFMLEKCSATGPKLLQEGRTLNSDFFAYATKQLQTPKCQKLSQQFITLMKIS